MALSKPSIDSEKVGSSSLNVPVTLVVALFIVLRELCPQWKHWPSVDTLLRATGAGRSQAYEYARVLKDALPILLKRPGRPPAVSPAEDVCKTVLAAVNDHLRTHPGAVSGNGPRTFYSDGFRRFVLDLAEPGGVGADLSLADLAALTGVPIGTLKTWLFPPQADPSLPATETPKRAEKPPDEMSSPDTLRDTHLRLIFSLWQGWEGTFQAFCVMLRTEYRIPYGDTFIGSFLRAMRLRQPRRRLPVEAPWSSGTYRRFSPGGQWLGDGHEVTLQWGQTKFKFNLETIHDVASDATVGLAVTATEDEEALRLAYAAALETTTGQPPEVLMLDNKACNHSPGAAAATPGTIIVPSTPGRGQAKAPIEGSYGLFQGTLPPLVITGTTPGEQAREVVELVATAWFRGRNGKPRARLNNKTPAEAYGEANVTAEEREAVQDWIRRQRAARETRNARRDPVRIELLRQGLADANLPDPEGRHARALAYYCQEAIVRGLATFRTKQDLGKVPPGADPIRYLGGIIRKLDTRIEQERMSVHLLEQRLRLRDLTLAPLQHAAQQTREEQEPPQQVQVFVDRTLQANLEVDAQFWMAEAAASLRALPILEKASLYTGLCRRVAAAFSTDRLRREDLIDRLAAAVAATGSYVPDALSRGPRVATPVPVPPHRSVGPVTPAGLPSCAGSSRAP